MSSESGQKEGPAAPLEYTPCHQLRHNNSQRIARDGMAGPPQRRARIFMIREMDWGEALGYVKVWG
jgi:hypothetical protein